MQGGYDSATWSLTRRPEVHASFGWDGARFESAQRDFTRAVEGRIVSNRHLVMVTLSGGAERHVFRTDDGARHDGRDRAGAVSFLPAGCGRDLALRNVGWRWGAIAIEPSEGRGALAELAPFAADADAFIVALIGEFDRLMRLDGALDPTWADAMVAALAAYLVRRDRPGMPVSRHRLAAWQIRATRDRIEAQLSGPIRIADLAMPLGLSEGHFHRAFLGATGCTPLAEITARRLDRAAILLAQTRMPLSEIAFEVGFASQSHLARLFRKSRGIAPGDWRRQAGQGAALS